MPAKVEAGVLQVNTRGLRKYNAAETLVGLAGTHRYSRVQACAINQPSDKFHTCIQCVMYISR